MAAEQSQTTATIGITVRESDPPEGWEQTGDVNMVMGTDGQIHVSSRLYVNSARNEMAWFRERQPAPKNEWRL